MSPKYLPRLGVTLTTFGETVNAEMLQALEQSGAATVEVKPRVFSGPEGQEGLRLFKQFQARTGVIVSTVHAWGGDPADLSALDEAARPVAMEHMDFALSAAVELGAPTIVVHASDEPIPPADRAARMARCQQGLAEFGLRCRKAGRRIAVELLPRTCLGCTADELLEIIRPLDADTFGVCVDTNHLMNRAATLPDVIRQLGHKLIAMHVSDYDGIDEKHALPGKGVLDWAAVLDALGDVAYTGPFTYECKFKEGTPAQRAALLAENFRWLCGLKRPGQS